MTSAFRGTRPGRPSALLALSTSILTWSAPLAAQVPDQQQENGVPRARATLAVSAPTIDGILDDAVWQGASVLGGFTQRVPSDGRPATEPTEVRFLFDEEALYVGVWAFDSDPGAIVEGEAIRDYDLAQSDGVLLILDTFRDEQNAFVFGTNPVGIEYDGQVANSGQGGGGFFLGGGNAGNRRQQGGAGGGFNLNWDGSWIVRTSRDVAGWYAEFRIPFSTLRYAESEEQTWGLNVSRRVRRLNEQSFWAPIPREFDEYRLNYAGRLEGLAPPSQRLVRVTPYGLQRAVRDYQAGDPGYSYPTEVGGDVKVQITQGLTLDLTVNTDFAQVEVDEVQTNLTRFSLFFPEKRPFFLENAGFFQVGGGGADLFFSRRVGISSEGPVPILGGGRVSGRVAGLNVGVLHIEADDLSIAPGVTAVPQNQYSVARVAKELPNRSRLGAAFLRRASDTTNDWSRTYAVDGQLGIGEAITFTSFLAGTDTPGLTGRDHAFDVQGGWTSRRFRGTMQYRQIGEDFNPELGFLPRSGYHYGQVFGMLYFQPDWWAIREIRPHASYFTYRDIETGFTETSRVHIDSHFEFQDGMELHPAVNWQKEGLEEAFQITDDIVVPAGTYAGWELGWVFFTNESAPISFNGGFDAGGFLSGNRVHPYGTITGRYGSKLSLSLRVDYNDVSLAEGDFEATVLGLRLAYFVTPRISVQSLTQYSDLADAWSTNIRLAWLDTAGSGLFVVFNQANGFQSLARDTPLNRAFTVKYSRLFDLARW
ncbi:MAG: carbohydrate binding family 9 domain-containing protein [Gemmatimonadota bacterium]|nr:carbohydrate binding family 9 domain-containing protein [Gemmatimonadota bacterium]